MRDQKAGTGPQQGLGDLPTNSNLIFVTTEISFRVSSASGKGSPLANPHRARLITTRVRRGLCRPLGYVAVHVPLLHQWYGRVHLTGVIRWLSLRSSKGANLYSLARPQKPVITVPRRIYAHCSRPYSPPEVPTCTHRYAATLRRPRSSGEAARPPSRC